jgi:hypothetical protein
MNQSIWERRQAVASRLEGHAQQERGALEELDATFTAASLRLEDVDPRGCLQASVASVVHVAAGRPGFDLVLGTVLGHGIRVRTDAEGHVQLTAVALSVGPPAPEAPAAQAPVAEAPAPQAVASELASLLWQR